MTFSSALATPFGRPRRIASALSAATFAIATVAAEDPARAQNLIQNPGFETGTASPWVTGGTYAICSALGCAGNTPYSGTYFLALPTGNGTGTASQDVTLSTAGRYQLSFHYESVPGYLGTFRLVTTINGNTILDVTGPAATWSQFSTTVTLAAGVNSLSFVSELVASAGGAIGIDNVSLLLLPPQYLLASLPQGTPANVANVAGAIDSVAGALLRPGFDTLGNLRSDQLLAVAPQLTGEAAASSAQSGIIATTQFIKTMFDAAFDNATSAASGLAADPASGAALGYAPESSRLAGASDAFAADLTPPQRQLSGARPRWQAWGAYYGSDSRTAGNATLGSSAAQNRVWGMVAGADYTATPDTRVGFAIGGGTTQFGLDNGLGGGRSDLLQAGAYARHRIGAAYLAGAVSYGWQTATTDRTVTINGSDTLHAKFDAHAIAGRVEAGSRVATPLAGITPYAALQSTAYYLPSYGETATSGAGTFALNVDSRKVTATRTELGARWDKTVFTDRHATFALRATTAWAHDWNSARTATATFQGLPGSSAFTVNGATPSADVFLVSLGGGLRYGIAWTLLASYEGEYSRNTTSHGGKGTLKYAW